MKHWQKVTATVVLGGTAVLGTAAAKVGPWQTYEKTRGLLTQGLFVVYMVQDPWNITSGHVQHRSFTPEQPITFGDAAERLENRITACTWNAYHGGGEGFERTFNELMQKPNLVLGLQEMPNPDSFQWKHLNIEGKEVAYVPDKYLGVDPSQEKPSGAFSVGNALVSSFPLENVRTVNLLDLDMQPFRESTEVRHQTGLLADIAGVTVGTAHPSSNTTPIARAVQTALLLGDIPTGPAVLPVDANLFYTLAGPLKRILEPANTLYVNAGYTHSLSNHGLNFADHVFYRGFEPTSAEQRPSLEPGHYIVCADFQR